VPLAAAISAGYSESDLVEKVAVRRYDLHKRWWDFFDGPSSNAMNFLCLLEQPYCRRIATFTLKLEVAVLSIYVFIFILAQIPGQKQLFPVPLTQDGCSLLRESGANPRAWMWRLLYPPPAENN
jgi:hypothetical protein